MEKYNYYKTYVCYIMFVHMFYRLYSVNIRSQIITKKNNLLTLKLEKNQYKLRLIVFNILCHLFNVLGI